MMTDRDIVEEKKAWRSVARDLFAAVSPEERAEIDAALCARLRDCVREAGFGMILGYMPMRDEADVTVFFRQWLVYGGRLALPVWVGERDLVLRAVDDLDAQVKPGRRGILEPVAECPEVSADAIDLVIVPGRFFSERCERIGRGAGCYDRLLAGCGARTLGVAYDFQVAPALPVNADDVPVDAVVTSERVIGDWKFYG